MKSDPSLILDIRQSPEWADYMRSIGWQIEKIDQAFLFIKKIPFINRSIIKVQHPTFPLDFKKIDIVAKKYKSLALILEPHLLNYQEKDFIKNNYQLSKLRFAHTATVKIDLTPSLEKIFSNFSENARRQIKKFQKQSIEILKLTSKDLTNHLETFYNLYQTSAKLHKYYPLSFSEFTKKINSLKNKSLFLLAQQNNQPIGFLWIFIHQKTAAYIHPGASKTGYNLSINYLLVWEALKLCQKKGAKVFDFEAIYDPRYPNEHKSWQNFTEFKKRFHGELVYYPPVWIKFYSLPFKLFYLCSTFLSK